MRALAGQPRRLHDISREAQVSYLMAWWALRAMRRAGWVASTQRCYVLTRQGQRVKDRALIGMYQLPAIGVSDLT